MTSLRQSEPKTGWYIVRFPLRWLLLFVAALAAIFAWMAPSIHRELAWRRAVAPIRRAGGNVAWFADTARSPDTAASISLGGSAVTDADLALVGKFRNTETLILRDTQITDSGLQHLTSLRALQWVDLRGTRVTDAGIAELRRALPETKIAH